MKIVEMTNDEKGIFLEMIFNECKSMNFEINVLEKTALKYKTDIKTLRSWLKLYIYNYMDCNIREKYAYIKKLGLTFKYKKIDTSVLGLWKNKNQKKSFLYDIFELYKKNDCYDLIISLEKEYGLSENEALNILNESIMMYHSFNGKRIVSSANTFYRSFNYYLGTGEEKYVIKLLDKYSVDMIISRLNEFLTYYIEPKDCKETGEKILNLINNQTGKDLSGNSLKLKK